MHTNPIDLLYDKKCILLRYMHKMDLISFVLLGEVAFNPEYQYNFIKGNYTLPS